MQLVHRVNLYTAHVLYVGRFARMPKLGNQVCVGQYLNVNAHGVEGTMTQPDTGTKHGQLAPSCI